jgi:hypothetical protein
MRSGFRVGGKPPLPAGSGLGRLRAVGGRETASASPSLAVGWDAGTPPRPPTRGGRDRRPASVPVEEIASVLLAENPLARSSVDEEQRFRRPASESAAGGALCRFYGRPSRVRRNAFALGGRSISRLSVVHERT